MCSNSKIASTIVTSGSLKTVNETDSPTYCTFPFYNPEFLYFGSRSSSFVPVKSMHSFYFTKMMKIIVLALWQAFWFL